jgi:hypothetical protein
MPRQVAGGGSQMTGDSLADRYAAVINIPSYTTNADFRPYRWMTLAFMICGSNVSPAVFLDGMTVEDRTDK